MPRLANRLIAESQLRRSLLFRQWTPRRVSRKRAMTRMPDGTPAPVNEHHYSPSELAESWGVSVETIRCIFREEPGVLKIARPATKTKRGYMTLRIPQSVAERVHRRMAA